MKITSNIALGIFFLFLQIVIIISNWGNSSYEVYIWFCNHTPLLFAIGMFLKEKDFLQGIINVGLLGQFVWVLDFLSQLLFNSHLFGVTRYLFENPFSFSTIISILIHILSTFIVLFYTYSHKPNTKGIIISIVYMIFLYLFSVLFTNPTYNINCVFTIEVCGISFVQVPLYTYLWPILTSILVILPTHGLQYLLYKITKR